MRLFLTGTEAGYWYIGPGSVGNEKARIWRRKTQWFVSYAYDLWVSCSWSIIGFGGKVEKGETIDQGARRELLEESEIEAIDLVRVGILMFTFENDPVGLETHIFTVKAYKGEPAEYV
jgi:ADP-ribose pyrophosphatase YjhB (NUDIX family)